MPQKLILTIALIALLLTSACSAKNAAAMSGAGTTAGSVEITTAPIAVSPTQTPTPIPTATLAPTPTSTETAASIPVLEYHSPTYAVTDFRMQPDWFLAQIKWLHDNGYYTPTRDELVGFINGEKNIPAKPVVLRFDLGLVNMTDYEQYVIPALRQYGFHALFFVLTSSVSDSCGTAEKPVLCWSNLKAWSDEGIISVESHGVNHPVYANLTYSEMLWDAKTSADRIENHIGKRPYFLAYPYDTVPADTKAVKAAGYLAAFGGDRSVRSIQYGDSQPYDLPSYYPYSTPAKYPELVTASGPNGRRVTFEELMQSVTEIQD
jgi:Predicted xylanase/chitin deacetylase